MNRRFRTTLACATALGLALGAAISAPAMARPVTTVGSQATQSHLFPTELQLPNGFLPEGIAIGLLPFAFFGSRADGDLFRVNLITGQGTVFSQGPGAGNPSVGLKVDLRGRVFVSGGSGGNARVVNGITGEVLASYTFATAPTFVNDVILTPQAAYFTDSQKPVLYKVPFGRFGELPAQAGVVTIPLTGDYVHGPGFNLNGISRTPDGRGLIVVQSGTGFLFTVNPATGVTARVDLGGALVTNGDGLLQKGRTLYVVQNQLNRVAVVKLNQSATSGTVEQLLTDPRFDIPTTAAAFGDRLYLVNARFSTPPTPDTTYTSVAIPRP
jgi:sugar lactone lactonase YvrE